MQLLQLLLSLPIPILLHLFCFPLLCQSVSSGRKSPNPTTDSPVEQCHCAQEESFDIGIDSGIFKSPGFPTRYCNNLMCSWSIVPMADSFVGAMFDKFETEHRFDVLEVYQTQWNGSTLMEAKQAIIHGSFDPKTMEKEFFSSVGGGLKFRFITDSTDSDFEGFLISFRRYSKDVRSVAPCPQPFQVATSDSQTLPVLSPKFHIDSSCIFMIGSSEAVNLTINQFRSKSLALKVYETENFQVRSMLERPLIKIQPGSVPSLPMSVTSRTASITVLLSTLHIPLVDGSVLGRNAEYEMQFMRTTSLCACPPSELVVSRVRPSSLTSPGFPLEYCDAANCTVNVALEGPRAKSRTKAEGLRLKFEAFQTEMDMDYVAFYDNMGQTVISLSNEAKRIRHLTFDRPQFAMSFITDHSIVETGFNLTVEAFQMPIECVCPTSPRTLLTGRSHHEENSFDQRKCRFLDCFWLIKVPNANSPSNAYHRIVIRINHTISSASDFVMVYPPAGGQRESNPFARKLNSLSAGIEQTEEFEGLLPVGIWLHREWDSEDVDPEPGEPSLELNFSYEWREVCQCGQSSFMADPDKWQTLNSPDFPNTYCRSMRCQWRLNAPEGHHILLNITSFSTEADQDFLYIFDGNATTLPHLEMLHGILYKSFAVHGKREVMTLLFISDSSIQAKGFESLFRAEPNPGMESAGLLSGHGRFPKTLVFFLFLILAGIGIAFLFSRSNQQQFLGGGPWTGFMANPIAEGRVLFARRWTHRRQPSSSPDLSVSDHSSPNDPSSTAHSAFNNPMFHFRLP